MELPNMELPDDVLRLVREYARPQFQYFKEYNHALRIVGKKSWKGLKDKLHTNPEQVLPALFVYQDAFLRKKEVYELREAIRMQTKKERSDEMDLPNQAIYAKRAGEDSFWLCEGILYEKDEYEYLEHL